MGRPPDCSCHCECCRCRPWTLLQWSGDRDFTGDLDIRNYPDYVAEMLVQRNQTSMLWRIRYNPDDEFLEYLTDTRTLVAGSQLNGTAFIDYMPFSNAAAILSGPLRDGLIYGLDMVPAGHAPANIYRWPGPLPFGQQHPETAAVDRNFIGTSDLKVYNTNGSSDPGNWTLEDHPDNPIAIPWVLELGCSRCCDSSLVTWPDHTNWHYDPWVPYGGVGGGYVATDPDNSTLTSVVVDGACQSSTPDDIQSIYWPGDEAEPDHASICPPGCIVWDATTHAFSIADGWSGGGARYIPGKSLPSDAASHPAEQIAAATGGVNHLVGWSGRGIATDVVRAARGADAEIGNVNSIWIVTPHQQNLLFGASTFLHDFVASDAQWIVDWLALGEKTLIVDTPWKHVADSFPIPSGGYSAATSASDFMSAIGAGVSFYNIETHNATQPWLSDVITSLTCVSTETHALAPDPETLFSNGDFGDQTLVPIGGGKFLQPPMGLSGGTALYEYQCVLSYGGAQTHPCVTVVEQGNGSRIIVGSISIQESTGIGLSGLCRVPNIANMISRALTSA